MRERDGVYLIEWPSDVPHDAFFAAGVDSGEFYA